MGDRTTARIGCLPSNDPLARRYEVLRDVVYSTAQGRDLALDLIVPWSLNEPDVPVTPMPLVVFVQGSGWTTPKRGKKLPDLCAIAREGYVVATVSHRDAVADGAPAPAYLVDVKCAIRFLRMHADEYGIDPSRVAIWGSSSGGNTAQLVGVTGDLRAFQTDEWGDESDAVQAVVSCFGPSDLVRWMEVMGKDEKFVPVHESLFPGTPEERLSMKHRLSPIEYVTERTAPELPPFLLLQGTDDPWVEPCQLERMHERLCTCGASSDAYFVDGAVHEGNFWSDEVLTVISEFFNDTLRWR